MKNLENIDWYKDFIYQYDKNYRPKLEIEILACLFYNPELLKTTVLTEKNFYIYPKYFKLFKIVYNKFNSLDFVLVNSILKTKKDRDKFLKFMTEDYTGLTFEFEKWEKVLLDRNEYLKDKKKVDDIIIKLLKEEIDYNEFIEEIGELNGKY